MGTPSFSASKMGLEPALYWPSPSSTTARMFELFIESAIAERGETIRVSIPEASMNLGGTGAEIGLTESEKRRYPACPANCDCSTDLTTAPASLIRAESVPARLMLAELSTTT